MIELEKLNLFLDEANSIVKSSDGAYQKLKPLCAFGVTECGKTVTFGIELRGYARDEEAFFLVARVDGSDDMFISSGYFTEHGGHCTSFAMTHDEPRGMNIQHGVLIEMRNLLARMVYNEDLSDFASAVLEELEKTKVKIQVVRYDGGKDSIMDETVEVLDRLEIKSEKDLEQQKTDAAKCNAQKPEVPDDTIGEEFAKAVGDREDKPDRNNPLDTALERTQVYQLKRETLLDRIFGFSRKLFHLDREREQLDSICGEMFDSQGEEDK